METPDLFSLFVRPLHGAGLRYMVSGSLASIFYGDGARSAEMVGADGAGPERSGG